MRQCFNAGSGLYFVFWRWPLACARQFPFLAPGSRPVHKHYLAGNKSKVKQHKAIFSWAFRVAGLGAGLLDLNILE